MPLTYRRWTADDLKEIPNVIWLTWLDAYASFIPEDDMQSYLRSFYNDENLTKLFLDPNVSGYVARDGDRVVGFVRTVFKTAEQRYYVSSLYILPSHQRKGIGTRLMQLAAAEARARGLDRVWIGVMVENKSGLAWYRRLGYEVREEQPFTMGKTTVAHYIGYVTLDALANATSAASKTTRTRES